LSSVLRSNLKAILELDLLSACPVTQQGSYTIYHIAKPSRKNRAAKRKYFCWKRSFYDISYRL